MEVDDDELLGALRKSRTEQPSVGWKRLLACVSKSHGWNVDPNRAKQMMRKHNLMLAVPPCKRDHCGEQPDLTNELGDKQMERRRRRALDPLEPPRSKRAKISESKEQARNDQTNEPIIPKSMVVDNEVMRVRGFAKVGLEAHAAMFCYRKIC